MTLKVLFLLLLISAASSCNPVQVYVSGTDATQDGGSLQDSASHADASAHDSGALADVASANDRDQDDVAFMDAALAQDSGTSVSGVQISGGRGGDISAGQTGTWSVSSGSGSILVRIPASYDPQHLASPVVFLFNEEINQWAASAEDDALIIVDLDE